MKIVYCLNSIKGIGGIQRVTAVKAKALAEIEGNIVFIIVTDNNNEIQCEELSSKVNFIHLDVNYYDDDWMPGIKSKLSQIYKKIKHKKELKKILNAIQPDVVIAVGQSEKFICRKGLVQTSKPIYIRELHYVTHYRNVLVSNNWTKWMANIQNFIDFGIFCKFFYDAIIPLTPKDLNENWKHNKVAFFIPNPITVDSDIKLEDKFRLISNKEKKIIAVGRLTYVKNFKSLINSFSMIASNFPEWKLEIYGEGEDRNMLFDLIVNHKLENQVYLKGFTNDVEKVMKESSILALTSLMEGFPLVLFEAMNFGNVIVAYDCDFGPSFIIDDNINGFLVDTNNEILFSQKLKIIMESNDIRERMANNAIEKSQKFMPEIIANQWMELFNSLLLKNQRRQ